MKGKLIFSFGLALYLSPNKGTKGPFFFFLARWFLKARGQQSGIGSLRTANPGFWAQTLGLCFSGPLFLRPPLYFSAFRFVLQITRGRDQERKGIRPAQCSQLTFPAAAATTVPKLRCCNLDLFLALILSIDALHLPPRYYHSFSVHKSDFCQLVTFNAVANEGCRLDNFPLSPRFIPV